MKRIDWNLGAIRYVTAMLVAAICSGPCAAEGVQIREGYVRELPPGQSTSAAYMKIVNDTNRAVAIVAATSDVAQSAEIHEIRAGEAGTMRMDMVRRLSIPAHGTVQFAPGGYHLMLVNLKRTLHAGDSVSIMLLDEEGKEYKARVPVVKMLGAGQ